LAFTIGKAVRYVRDAHKRRLKSTHKKLLTRYKEEQQQQSVKHSTNASYQSSSSYYSSTDYMSTSNSSTSTSSSTISSNEAKEDPMSKYDLVAPELGVGLDRWVAIRKAWQTGCKDPSTIAEQKRVNAKKKKYDKYVDVDSIVEHLVNPRKPAFKHPVPLPEMIVILIELWEADGLYD